MDTTSKVVLMTSVLFLAGCTLPQQYDYVKQKNPFEVQQNDIGEFVFCNDQCPSITEKRLAVVQPRTATPKIVATANKSLVNVFFKLGSSQLTASGKKTLDKLLPNLKSTETIYLRGWADSTGGKNTKINKKLAKKRADIVEKYLIARGVTSVIQKTSEPPCCNNSNTRVVVVTYR